MNQVYHALPRELFDELATGGGGEAAARVLTRAEQSKHIVLLRGVLAAAQAADGSEARLARRGYDLLARVQRHDPRATGTVIRSPAVGAWAQQAILASGTRSARPDAQLGRLSAIAAAAAIRARFPAEVEVPLTGGIVMLPTLGAALTGGSEGETATVRTGPGGTQVRSVRGEIGLPDDPHQDVPGWQALRRVRTSYLDVLIDDLDPFRMKASESLAPRLTAAQADDLAECLRGGWRVLESHHAGVAAEVAAMVTVIVPFLPPAEGQVSASAAESFGAVALSSSADQALCGAILAHEIQHLKLSAVLEIVALTMRDDGQRYYAPWRTDPRPISGLLHGAYAFMGISAYWRQQRHAAEGKARLRADTEFARWRAASAQVADTLYASGRLTQAGQHFVERMRLTLGGWQHEPVLPAAHAAALRTAELHKAQWELDNGRPADGRDQIGGGSKSKSSLRPSLVASASG